MSSNQLTEVLAIVAQGTGVLAALLNLALVLMFVRSNRIFRDELTSVDRLMSEYVRFRDLLLSARKPEGGVSGLRLMGDEAFREAWRNFNQQLDSISARYRERAARLRTGLIVVAVLFVLGGANWGLMAGAARHDWRQLALVVGSLLGTLALWLALLLQLRQNGRLMKVRTSGSYLLAPWPSDGGTPDRQFSLLGKFLPVEVGPTPEESSPEVAPSA